MNPNPRPADCKSPSSGSSRVLGSWVVADACLSRKKIDWKIALQRMVVDGARITTTESIIFEILETAENSLFKEFSQRIR